MSPTLHLLLLQPPPRTLPVPTQGKNFFFKPSPFPLKPVSFLGFEATRRSHCISVLLVTDWSHQGCDTSGNEQARGHGDLDNGAVVLAASESVIEES